MSACRAPILRDRWGVARLRAVAPEAPLRMTRNGLVADVDGWFVVNARESRWRDEGPLGVYCTFEGKRRFRQLGINVNVLEPGQAIGMYHRENAQEGFLVLAGECTLVVEGEERQMRAWDFFHCPPGTEHVIVGSGDAASVVVAVGARGRGVGGGVVYRVSDVAARFGASVERETRNAAQAYAKAHAGLPRSRWIAYRDGWLPNG
jgi:uncharacterized cupin superfamily protein